MAERDNMSELPKGWILAELGEILEPSNEKADPNSYPKVPYIGLEHIEKNKGRLLGHGYSDEVRSTKTKFSSGDLLYGKLRPYLNKVLVPEIDGICSTDILVFRKSELFSNKFFLYRFLAENFVRYANLNTSGVQHPRTDFKKLSHFQVVFPPLPEQNRIVEKIDEFFTKLDAGVKTLEKTKAQLRRYRQSVLKAAVEGKLTEEWQEAHKYELEPASVLLERILKEQRSKWEAEQLSKMKEKGKAPKDDSWKKKYKEPIEPDRSKMPQLPNGWTCSTIVQITDNHDGKRIPVRAKDRAKRRGEYPYYGASGIIDYIDDYIFDGEFLLIAEDGANLLSRSTPIAFLAKGKFWVNNHAHVVQTNGSIPLRFLEAFFNSINLQFYVTGSAQPKLTQASMNQIIVPLPSLPEQHRIVEEVERFLSIADEIETTIDVELKRSERLRQSILKQAFSGKLVPQDPTDEPATTLLERIKEEKAKLEAEKKPRKRLKTKKAIKQRRSS